MSRSSKAAYSMGQLTVDRLLPNQVTITKSSQTQGTSITTAVTHNAPAGTIKTVSTNLATGGTARFTVNNSFVQPSSLVLANITNYSVSATQGSPSVFVSNVTQGSFSIVLKNLDWTYPLGGNVSIGYRVL